MASAILPSRNDARSSDFITKFTESNLNFTRFQKIPNRNPNPNSSHFVIGGTGRDAIRTKYQQRPSTAAPESAFVNPPISSIPANSYGYRYITFRLDSYTRRELMALKKRLISDLERVRILRQFVCSTPVHKNNYCAPQLELPTTPVTSHTGQKRTKPLPPLRDTKKQCGRLTDAQRRKLLMRECGQILGKLMKHKNGWVFNTPVDAAAMKLYDYHNVITNPMDLGTIKTKLVKNEYESPLAFASDVRLTFENAMVYNGKGSDVFVMAERLLLLFEDMFRSNQSKPISVEKPVLNATVVVDTQVANQTMAANSEKQMIRTAKKPEMTAAEKAELAASLMNLKIGPEGMHQIMAIVKKGAGLEREGDEIELDLAVLDNETLWELHSFISPILKEATTTSNMKGVVTNLIASVQTDSCRERDAVEEDVDIGEETQLTNFPSVEIEKDVVNGSDSSSDSSSDSDSSSSESGSGTSYNEQEVNSTPKGVVPSEVLTFKES